ncbi:hypothetical protein ACJBU5_11150, partial [Streptococcus suis]
FYLHHLPSLIPFLVADTVNCRKPLHVVVVAFKACQFLFGVAKLSAHGGGKGGHGHIPRFILR